MIPSIPAERATQTSETGVPGLILRLASGFLALWRYPLLRFWPIQILVLLCMTAFCAGRAYLGLRGIQGYSHDAFMLLDGAWRMSNGQRPHIDFYSHVGVLTFFPTLLGFWMTHGKPEAFGYGQAATGLFLGLWAFLLGRKFFNDLPTVLLALSVTTLVASPSVLGFPPFMIGSAMTYNRCGYAVLALIFVEALAQPKDPDQRHALLGGVSTGAALAFLFYLKVTYFAFAVIFLLIMLPFQRSTNWRRPTAILVTFLCLSFAGAAYFGFHLEAIFKDLLNVAASKHLRYDLYLSDVILNEAGTLLVLGLLASASLFFADKPQSSRLLAIGTAVICAIGVVLILGNYEQSGFPLAVFLALIIVDTLISQLPVWRNSSELSEALVVSLGTVFIAVFLVMNVLTMGYGFGVAHRRANRVSGLASPILQSFVPIDLDRNYANFVDDGLALVQKYRRPGETIMSLDFTNPFSYGLGAKPAPGGNTVMQYKTTFNDAHRQSAESLFGSADLVAIPNPGHFSDDSLDWSIYRIYGPYLDQHFQLLGQSRDWQLYRRNQQTRPTN